MNINKLSKLGRGLIYISLFTPLFIIPSTVWEYIFVRNIIFYVIGAALLILSFVYARKNKNNLDFFWMPLCTVILGFVAIKILSGFLGVDSNNSFFGSGVRMDGSLSYIMLAGWLFAAMVFLDGREKWHKAFKILVIVALMSSAFAIIQTFFPAGNSFIAGKADGAGFFSYRLIGTLGNPIFFAGYLLPHIFLCLYLFLKEEVKKNRYFWAGVAVFLAMIVVLTQTRGAIASLAITLVILGIIAGIHFFKNKKLFKKLLLFGLPSLAVMGIIVRLVLWAKIKSIFVLAGTAGTRLIFWKIGFLGFFDKWLFGWGPENYNYVFSKFYDPMLLKYSFYETWADKPHNQFIEILSTMGIAGFVFWAGIIFFALRALWRLAKAEGGREFLPYLAIGGAIISYLGHIFFSFDTEELRIVIFLILGFIVFAEAREFHKGEKKGQSRLIRIITVLCIVAIYSLFMIGTGTIRAAYDTNRAHISIINNQYSEALYYFKNLAKIKTPYINNDWEFLSDSVLKADAAGQLPQSIEMQILPVVIDGLEKAANGNALNFSYHFRLGQMYNLAGTHLDAKYLDKSVAELLKAKEISPKRQTVDLTLAEVYYSKRDVDAGIKTLEDLVKANENISPEPYWYLGLFYDAAGQYDKSYAYMSTAMEKGRSFISQNERVLYVNVLGRQKDYARMAPVYEEIIKNDKENPQWWANLATVYFELKRYEDARKAARQAIFLSPQFGDEGERFLKRVDAAENGK